MKKSFKRLIKPKKKHIKSIVIVLILSISFMNMVNHIHQVNVKADSGWDSSYDSWGSDSSWDTDSSWGSDSSWDRDYSWDRDSSFSSSNSGVESPISSFLLLLIILIVFIYYLTKMASRKKQAQEKSQDLNTIINSGVEQELMNLFIQICEAYTNFDYEMLKKLTSPHTYERYQMELRELESKQEKRIIKDVRFHSFKISNYEKEKGMVTALFKVSFCDYNVDVKNNVTNETENQKVLNRYRCIFYKQDDLWLLDQKQLMESYKVKNSKPMEYEEVSDDQVKLFFPDKTLATLKKELYDKFVKIQVAWMNFDYESLQELCSNEIYNTYHEQLEALKLKNIQNVMNGFEKMSDRIMSITKSNDKVIVEYYLSVEFYDYVINMKTQKVKKGRTKQKLYNIYKLTYTMSSNVITNCPNCGGKIKQGTTKCEHCQSVIVQNSNSLVLSNKRKIN